VTSYNGQGVGKLHVKKSDHAIIYTGRQAPPPLTREQPGHGEAGMQPQPIRVDPDQKDEKLDPNSRIDFARPHVIQHYQKVKSFGKVNRDSMAFLLSQFRAVQLDSHESSGAGLLTLGARSSSSAVPRTLPAIDQAIQALVLAGRTHEEARAVVMSILTQAQASGTANFNSKDTSEDVDGDLKDDSGSSDESDDGEPETFPLEDDDAEPHLR
jgi:hypothetical protein